VKRLPRILRLAKGTRKTLGALALAGWVIYLGYKFMWWFEMEGGAKKMAEWSRK